MRSFPIFELVCATLALAAAACGGDSATTTGAGAGGEGGATGCSVADQTGCKDGQACELVQGGKPACFTPVSVKGRVYDAVTMNGIAGARVVARDVNEAAVSTVAITKADGTYSLDVPAVRDASGKPISYQVTLRADAEAYLTFPEPPRVALPFDLDAASGDPPVVKSVATDVALLPLADASTLGSISGTVTTDHPGGTLVVAGGATGVADVQGAFAVFNVPAGAGVEVDGYLQGVNFTPASVAVTANHETTGVTLNSAGAATSAVSGSISIVNGNGNSVTSVVLAVEATFNETAAHGEVPVGLRAENVTSGFTITGVPDGKYVVLAAFEDDGLVRDPDTSIGGTSIAHITVPGAAAQQFKVTGAIDVVSPGADGIDTVTSNPTFTFARDPSADHYEVQVFDALGNQTWDDPSVPAAHGSAPIAVAYAGPALQHGMIYQFRATSFSNAGVPISQTEDLRGVFLFQ
jgi:hypothetical protein